MIETPHVNLGYFIIGAAGSLKCRRDRPGRGFGAVAECATDPAVVSVTYGHQMDATIRIQARTSLSASFPFSFSIDSCIVPIVIRITSSR